MNIIFALLKNVSLFQIFTLASLAINFGGFAYIKHQDNQIEQYKTSLIEYKTANQDMSSKILIQNAALVDGAKKYEGVQAQLDKASGINTALGVQFDKFRKDLGTRPVPVTCPESIKDLKTIIVPIVKDWNTK